MKYLKSKVAPKRTDYYQNKVYKTAKWRKFRLALLAEQGGYCVQCGNTYPDSELHVDHIKRLSDGGSLYALSNLQILCVRCHGAKTYAETIGGVGQKHLQKGRDTLA